MPHIKWLGIIKDDLGQYQIGDLLDGAKKGKCSRGYG